MYKWKRLYAIFGIFVENFSFAVFYAVFGVLKNFKQKSNKIIFYVFYIVIYCSGSGSIRSSNLIPCAWQRVWNTGVSSIYLPVSVICG